MVVAGGKVVVAVVAGGGATTSKGPQSPTPGCRLTPPAYGHRAGSGSGRLTAVTIWAADGCYNLLQIYLWSGIDKPG